MISKTLKKVNFIIQNLKKNQKGKKIVFLTDIHKIMILTKKKKKNNKNYKILKIK